VSNQLRDLNMTDPAARFRSARVEIRIVHKLLDHVAKEAIEHAVGSDERVERLRLLQRLNAHLRVVAQEEKLALADINQELSPPLWGVLREPSLAELAAMDNAPSKRDETETVSAKKVGRHRSGDVLARMIRLGGAHNLPSLVASTKPKSRSASGH
jgi:hypothetical protein